MNRLMITLVLALTAAAACSDESTGVTQAHDYSSGDLLARPGPPTGQLYEPGARELELGRDSNPVLYIPTSYDPESPAPLLVLFHGSPSSAAFWEFLYDDAERLGVVLLMMNSQRGIWDVYFKEGFSWDASTTDEALQLVFDHVAIDPDFVAFGGFSSGATYTAELAPRNPDLVRQIIVWSGEFASISPEEPLPRVFVSHGDEDDQLPVYLARKLVRTLEFHGYDVTYVEFEGGHELRFSIVDQTLDWWLP